MAAFPICYKTRYKDQNIQIPSVTRQNDQRSIYRCVDMLRSFSSIPGHIGKSCSSYIVSYNFTKSNTCSCIAPRCLVYGSGASLHKTITEIQRNYSKRDGFSTVWCSLEHSTNEKQLRSLESYFGKLHGNTKLSPFDSSNRVMLLHHRDGQSRLKGALESLDVYLGKLNNGANEESYQRPNCTENYIEENPAVKLSSISKETERNYQKQQNTYVDMRRTRGENGPRTSTDPRQPDETCSLYLIGILTSINIAVFLFEMASPIRTSDLELFSIPLLYGAKINHLIVIGEWWRLVTPMFLAVPNTLFLGKEERHTKHTYISGVGLLYSLYGTSCHSGIFHMALSCWALVSFGPQVCKGYGSFTFLLIYILGGVSGNLTSFLHTPEPTVGGTGPVFAIIGAWLANQIQNRDVTGNDTLETMFHKALIVTALGFLLSNFGPIDDWTHFGAAFTGMAYGFFTSPILQLNDASSGTGREEGLKLVRQYGDSCKSLVVFTIFIVILSSFLFFIEPPLNALAFVNLVYMKILDATY